MRILVVEDDIDLNNIIVKKLSAEGYAVDSCFHGRDALEYLTSVAYDAAVMDIMMRKWTGWRRCAGSAQVEALRPYCF